MVATRLNIVSTNPIKSNGYSNSNPISQEYKTEEFGALTLRSRLYELDRTYGQSPVMKGSGIGDIYDSIA